MKRIVSGISVLACVLCGCVIQQARVVEAPPRHHPPEVIVEREPPVTLVEAIPVAPSPNHVWIGGYWAWHGGMHVWVPGHYALRPDPNVMWVPGHWERRPHGWIWIEGYWR